MILIESQNVLLQFYTFIFFKAKDNIHIFQYSIATHIMKQKKILSKENVKLAITFVNIQSIIFILIGILLIPIKHVVFNLLCKIYLCVPLREFDHSIGVYFFPASSSTYRDAIAEENFSRQFTANESSTIERNSNDEIV